MASLHGGSFSGDHAMSKIRALGGSWTVMFAGDDITPASTIIRHAARLLNPNRDRNDFYGLEETVDALRDAYHAERIQRATDAHLSVYGIDMAKFAREGVAMFGEAGASILRDRIEREVLSCDLLASGHTETGRAHVFAVEHPGTVKNYDTPGYWAIGSGSYLALASLLSRGQKSLTDLTRTVYHACEAKFAAEAAVGVGRWSSYLDIRYPDGSQQVFTSEAVIAMRAAWQEEARPKYPAKINTAIESFLEATPREPYST